MRNPILLNSVWIGAIMGMWVNLPLLAADVASREGGRGVDSNRPLGESKAVEAEIEEGDHRADENAALLYHLSFWYLQASRTIEEESQDAGGVWFELGQGRFEEFGEYFHDLDRYLSYFRQASKRRYCRWGVAPGTREHSDVLVRLEDVSDLAMGRFLWHIDHGRTGAALEDAEAVRRAVEHVGLPGLTFKQRIHLNLIRRVAEGLPALDRGAVKELRSRLEESDDFAWGELVSAKQWRLQAFLDEARRKLDSESKGVDVASFKSWAQEELDLPAGLDPLPSVSDADELRSRLDDVESKGRSILGLLEEDDWEKFEARYRDLRSQYERSPTGRLALVLAGNVGGAYESHKRYQIQRKLLEAAMALRAEGKAAFGEVLDPHSDEPFEYRDKPYGFRLKSTFRNEAGLPTALDVGGPEVRLLRVDSEEEIPEEGQSAVFVAKGADGALHFRVFKDQGGIAVNVGERDLRDRGKELEAFKQKVADLWDKEEWSYHEYRRAVRALKDVIGERHAYVQGL